MAETPAPIALQPWPEHPLKGIFTLEIIAGWKRSRQPPQELVDRWTILEADGSYDPASEIASHARGVRARKAAWDVYLGAAYACRLFEGPKGNDLRGRLTSKKAEDFRSAMSECMATWYLAGKYRLPINPAAPGRGAKNLEMVAFWNQQNFGVEVKAPYRPSPQDGIGHGDESDKLEDAVNTANKQFDDKGPNLLVLAPELPLPMYVHRASLLHALFGRSKIMIPISKITGGPAGPTTVRFFPEGKLLKKQKPDGSPGYRRISAILCIEETTIERYPSEHLYEESWTIIPPSWTEGRELHNSHVNQMVIEHNATVIHNPHAYHPLDQNLFRNLPQCIPDGNTMRWTDGHDTTV